jgi:hypothetical protein
MVNHMRDRYAKVGSHLAAQIAPYKVAAEFRLPTISRLAAPSPFEAGVVAA